MKILPILVIAALTPFGTSAETLPHISTHPQSTVVAPGSNVTFTVASTNATAYQWRFNGTNIGWGTASTLFVTNAQTTDRGYYMVVASNAVGCSPSQLAYLSVVWSNGILPVYNTDLPAAEVVYMPLCGPTDIYAGQPVRIGAAQLYAGPVPEFMAPVGPTRPIRFGYFGEVNPFELVPINPSETGYCRVVVTYNLPCGGSPFHHPSTTMALVAGGGDHPVPTPEGLEFPTYIEWFGYTRQAFVLGPNDYRAIEGETVTLQGGFYRGWKPGTPLPPVQWRKDGRAISDTNRFGSTTTFTLAFPNVTTEDAGIYDFTGVGDGGISSKVTLRVQTVGGQGKFRTLRRQGSDFVFDFEGAATRSYRILTSSNLTDWTIATTLNDVNGVVSVINPSAGDLRRYYRSLLLPPPL